MKSTHRPCLRLHTLVLAFGLVLAASAPAFAQRILIYPLEQEKGSDSTRWIGTGLAVGLDETLSLNRLPNVPYEELQAYYRQEGLVGSPEFSLSALTGLARQLGAGILVTGEYRVEDERMAVRLEVLDLSEDPKSLGNWEEREVLGNLLLMTRRLSRRLHEVIGRRVAENPPAVSPGAFESYIRGRIAEDPTLQEVYLRGALEIEPGYDNARCQLAEVLKAAGEFQESRELLEQLEPQTYPKAYKGLLLLAQFRMTEGDFPEARRLLLASLEAREGAEAHIELARLYLNERKPEEASRELAVAEQFGTMQEEIEGLKEAIRQEAEKAEPEAAESAGES